MLRWVVPLPGHIDVLTSEQSQDGEERGTEFREPEEEEVKLMDMNMGRSVNATHNFLKRSTRGDVAVAFVGAYWIGRKLEKGMESFPDYVGLTQC